MVTINENQKRIVVVLGMHRSGTSAITRGLEVLGVDIGDNTNLLPPTEHNQKGYFEDVDIYNLNVDILSHLGHDWRDVSTLPKQKLVDGSLDEFKERAINLLSLKIGDKPFGIKDPRVSLLLPFWFQVFEALSLIPSFVIALRHPLSVKKSLESRDGVDNEVAPEKSFFLWLKYTLHSVLETVNYNRVVVDFDLLIIDPKVQLLHIAEELALDVDLSSKKAKDYLEDFLDDSLRHTSFSEIDWNDYENVSSDAAETYARLLSVAKGVDDIDSDSIRTSMNDVMYRLKELELAFICLDSLDYKSRQRWNEFNSKTSELWERVHDVETKNSNILTENQALWKRVHSSELKLAETMEKLAETMEKLAETKEKLAETMEKLKYSPLEIISKLIMRFK